MLQETFRIKFDLVNVISVLWKRDIETLTQDVNKLLIEINDTKDENEELRTRLGLDPRDHVDLEEILKKREAQREQDKALNRVLTAEVKKYFERYFRL